MASFFFDHASPLTTRRTQAQPCSNRRARSARRSRARYLHGQRSDVRWTKGAPRGRVRRKDVLCHPLEAQPEDAEVREHPVADQWYEFASIVEYDRAIYASCRHKYTHILELLGAASAELGITRVFHKLDTEELYAFLGNIARFSEQYQKYGYVVLERTESGARSHHYSHPCYSPIFCASGTGFFLEAILRHGGKDADVVETRCHCRGDGVCTFEMTWK